MYGVCVGARVGVSDAVGVLEGDRVTEGVGGGVGRQADWSRSAQIPSRQSDAATLPGIFRVFMEKAGRGEEVIAAIITINRLYVPTV